MIDCYLERGTLYVLDDGGIKAERVVTDEGNGVLEIKNIAVYPEFHGRDYVKAPLEYPARTYRSAYSVLHHSVKYFFTFHYGCPIYDCRKQLVVMVCLQRKL
ncbi:MAG: GNAT family N-acetyltransferase [Christensenellales bacterium]|jgi:hypothetical protein